MLLRILKLALLLFACFCIFLFFLMFFLLNAKEDAHFNMQEAQNITYTPLVQIVPGHTLPPQIKTFRSNNNLDIARYNNRTYFAFRTAPVHFASEQTVLYVLSSTDNEHWNYETKFQFGSDVREPRFMVFKNKLFLYFFKGGSNMFSFAPEHIYTTEFAAPEKWSKPKPIYKPGFVIWRAKEHNGKAYMSVYYGVGLYSNETEPGHLQLLESTDGYNYKLVNNKEVSAETSAEEGEFEFDRGGNLYATIRLEIKGGKVCMAKKDDYATWTCKFTPYKYDSALMFRRNDDFYMIARRNIAGDYNRSATWLPKFLRSKYYLVRYSLTRKRTTLYKLNKKTLELEPLFDFPSRGDTAYAGILPLTKNKYVVFNYSSDIRGPDMSWLYGQLFGSNIYATILTFK